MNEEAVHIFDDSIFTIPLESVFYTSVLFFAHESCQSKTRRQFSASRDTGTTVASPPPKPITGVYSWCMHCKHIAVAHSLQLLSVLDSFTKRSRKACRTMCISLLNSTSDYNNNNNWVFSTTMLILP